MSAPVAGPVYTARSGAGGALSVQMLSTLLRSDAAAILAQVHVNPFAAAVMAMGCPPRRILTLLARATCRQKRSARRTVFAFVPQMSWLGVAKVDVATTGTTYGRQVHAANHHRTRHR